MHCKSYSHFFSKKFQRICVSLNVNFNKLLTNDVVSFEQLGPEMQMRHVSRKMVFKCIMPIHRLSKIWVHHGKGGVEEVGCILLRNFEFEAKIRVA